MSDWMSEVHFDANGLIPAIAQEVGTGRVLMVAWMNAESLRETAETGRAVYFSRSRGRLWRKGESSGHTQFVKEIRLDCDSDVILLQVEQEGGVACHTGRHSCFYSVLRDGAWHAVDPVLVDPSTVYGNSNGTS